MYLVDGIIEGSIKFALLHQRDVYSPNSAEYGQLFIEPDADVFETIKLCTIQKTEIMSSLLMRFQTRKWILSEVSPAYN